MRRTLIALVGLALVLTAATARADEVVLRGNYWRDRNTRVLQPEAELTKELPSGTVIGAHYLLDTITSASVAAGATLDHPFTELRNEAGFTIGQRVGRALLTAGYSYSSESDYWAHLINLGTVVDLFQKNTTLALSMSYGINSVAQRQGPTVFNVLGGLQTYTLIAGLSQVLSQRLLLNINYELGVIGFGSSIGDFTGTPNIHTGYQGNPYRSVLVGGSPVREVVPFQRVRQSLGGSLNWLIPTGGRLVPYIAFRPGYRFYWDDWGILSHSPEIRAYMPIGAFELRFTGRYYTQNSASFTSEVDGKPLYQNSTGLKCTTCLSSSTRGQFYYTSDPKLYEFDSFFVEGRVAISLRVLGRLKKLPLHSWLAGGVLELSYGHYFDSKVAHAAFGDADLAGLQLAFPL